MKSLLTVQTVPMVWSDVKLLLMLSGWWYRSTVLCCGHYPALRVLHTDDVCFIAALSLSAFSHVWRVGALFLLAHGRVLPRQKFYVRPTQAMFTSDAQEQFLRSLTSDPLARFFF